MRYTKAVGLIVLCLLLASFAVSGQKKKYGGAKPAKIEVAAIDTTGLKDLVTKEREHPLLVNFWATFCDPCRAEFPDLVKIDKDYRTQSLEFVTISLDDMTDIKTSVPQFLSSMKATMPAYLLNDIDPEPAIRFMDAKWNGGLPATFLYNAKGEVVFKHIGRVDIAELRNAIDKLVKKGDGQ
jgi:thiol-disulfide isomerase/thioredoxin